MKRPGGPLVQKPLKVNDVFYDPMHPPKIVVIDGENIAVGGRKLEYQDLIAMIEAMHAARTAASEDDHSAHDLLAEIDPEFDDAIHRAAKQVMTALLDYAAQVSSDPDQIGAFAKSFWNFSNGLFGHVTAQNGNPELVGTLVAGGDALLNFDRHSPNEESREVHAQALVDALRMRYPGLK